MLVTLGNCWTRGSGGRRSIRQPVRLHNQGYGPNRAGERMEKDLRIEGATPVGLWADAMQNIAPNGGEACDDPIKLGCIGVESRLGQPAS